MRPLLPLTLAAALLVAASGRPARAQGATSSDVATRVDGLLRAWRAQPTSPAELEEALVDLGRGAIAPLGAVLDHEREWGVAAGATGDAESDELVSTADDDPIAAAARAFAKLAYADGLPCLDRLLHSDLPRRRAIAVAALGRIPVESAVDLLVAALDDAADEVARGASDALVALLDAEPVLAERDGLCDRLRRSKNLAYAADVLARMPREIAHDALAAMVAQRDPVAQLAALSALWKIGDPDDAELVRPLIRWGARPEVRGRACVLAGHLGDRDALLDLIDALDDDDPGLTRDAHWALKQITLQPLGPDPLLWTEWRDEGGESRLAVLAEVVAAAERDGSRRYGRRRWDRSSISHGPRGSVAGASRSAPRDAPAARSADGRADAAESGNSEAWVAALFVLASLGGLVVGFRRRFKAKLRLARWAAPIVRKVDWAKVKGIDPALATVLGRVDLTPEPLAAAGVRPGSVSTVVAAARRWFDAYRTTLKEVDRQHIGATQRQRALVHLGRAELTSQREKERLAHAIEDLAACTAERKALLDGLLQMATDHLQPAARDLLATIHANRATRTLPVEYLVVERTDEEWELLGQAIASANLSAGSGGNEARTAHRAYLAQVRSDLMVILATDQIAANLDAVTDQWLRAAARTAGPAADPEQRSRRRSEHKSRQAEHRPARARRAAARA